VIDPWLAMILVLAVLCGLLVGLRQLQLLTAPHPEVVRKLLHVSMGLVTLTLPWLFDEGWPVVVLAAVSMALLGSLRLVKSLRCGVGSVIGGVGRSTLGELYFPIGIAVLFNLYLYADTGDPAHRLLLYVVPILLLTLADTAAGLVGIAYGRTRYRTSEEPKSAEGSTAFFMCSFFCVHIPLLLYTDLGKTEILLIALLMAFLAMMFEAIAWNGLDNLLLPLVSYLLLRTYYGMPVQELIIRLAITGTLIAILLVFTVRSTLVGNAVLGAFLVGYISWTLGGWQWLLPPLLLFVTYTWFAPSTERNRRRVHHIHAVVAVSSAGLIWLFLANIFDKPGLLLPYTVSFAAHLAIIGVARIKNGHPEWPCSRVLRKAVLTSWLVLLVPCLAAQALAANGSINMTPSALIWELEKILFGLVGVLLAALAFYSTQPGLHDCPLDGRRWLRQAAHAALGSALGLLPVYAL
jgi:phytol kinase